MSPFRDRPFTRLAMIGVAVAALTLAGCGRKGPLDPPPGASLANDTTAAALASNDPLLQAAGQGREGVVDRPAPAGPNKRIFLDNLLN